MFERYTETARRVIAFARYEASQFGSMTIESEHLLLGLVREDSNLTNRFNPACADIVRLLIGNRITIQEKAPTSSDLPLSAECKRILAYAAEEAERLNHGHIGTEHLILAILREPKCVAAEILDERGLKLNALREELARAPMPQEHTVGPYELRSFFSAVQSPALPQSGIVPDADTAKQIAEAVWRALYGAETVAGQTPLQTEQKHNVWIVSGSAASEAALFAFILRADGRILSVGRGSTSFRDADTTM